MNTTILIQKQLSLIAEAVEPIAIKISVPIDYIPEEGTPYILVADKEHLLANNKDGILVE